MNFKVIFNYWTLLTKKIETKINNRTSKYKALVWQKKLANEEDNLTEWKNIFVYHTSDIRINMQNIQNIAQQ